MSLWTDKFRPRHLSEVVGQKRLVGLLSQFIGKGIATAPHIILHGPPGTGKTTLALAFAADLYPDIPHTGTSTLYLNASDERSKTVVRERICEFLQSSWPGITRKIVILDEVETMTTDAQLTLRGLMDSPIIPTNPLPLFILLCNTLGRIVPLVRSRALVLFCSHLPPRHVQALLGRVAAVAAGTTAATEEPSTLSCMLHRGDMRSFLQRAQAGADPNWWIKWLQRLFNAPPSRTDAVWEAGLLHAPLWVLIRHVLVFASVTGFATRNAAAAAAWADWIRIAVAPSRTIAAIARGWETAYPKLTGA